ncbi:MAG: hypothetical protein EB084_23280, partial [Proteobacteria bacterium]|nr:hypothetical protein [Pseudomonadota bacterium]
DDKSAYFVSARKSGVGAEILLDGPFETHREAVLAIPSVRSHPRVEQDPSFTFGEAAIGTARAPRGSPVALRPAPEAPGAPSGPPPLPPLYQTETYLSNYGKSTSKEVPRGVYAYKLAGVVHSPTAEAAMIEQGWKILPTRGGGSYTHAIPPESGAQSTQTKRDTKAVVIKAVAPTEAALDAWADAVYAYFLTHPVEKPHSVRVSPTLIWSYMPPRVERWRTETSSYDGRAPEISEHVRYRGAEIRLFTGAGLIEREWRHPEDPTPAPSHMTYPRTRADRIKWPSSVHPASGSFASGGFASEGFASGGFASGVHDRLGRETTRLFGRDLSGGAEWSTDGAWRVAPGRYLVRVDEDWFVVQRKPDGEGGYIDTDLTPALRWGDAVRAAKGGDHGASASTGGDQRERLERMRAFAASHGFRAVVRGDRLEVHVPFGNRGEPPSIEYASTFSELRAILGY